MKDKAIRQDITLYITCTLKKRNSGRRGLNPRPSAWEADALPLSYFRAFYKQRADDFTVAERHFQGRSGLAS